MSVETAEQAEEFASEVAQFLSDLSLRIRHMLEVCREVFESRGVYPQVPSVPYTYPFGIPLSPPWVVTCQDGVATAATGTDLPTGERK